MGYKDRPPRLDRKKRFPARRNVVVQNGASAVAYIRASTDEQVLSPDAQREDILAWEGENLVPIKAWHEDLGVSGRSQIDQRPGLIAALESVHLHKAEFLVIASRDRLSRDVSLACMIEYEFMRSKARVITAREYADEPETPESLVLRRVLDAMAEYEVALIRRRTKAGMAAAAARGSKIGRPGMLNSAFGREMVAMVHDLHAAGFHSARVCRYMKYKYGRTLYGVSWEPSLVKRCLGMERPVEFLPMRIDSEFEE
jgi:DNA invertase Pin-like site-specific DNA recombinase